MSDTRRSRIPTRLTVPGSEPSDPSSLTSRKRDLSPFRNRGVSGFTSSNTYTGSGYKVGLPKSTASDLESFYRKEKQNKPDVDKVPTDYDSPSKSRHSDDIPKPDHYALPYTADKFNDKYGSAELSKYQSKYAVSSSTDHYTRKYDTIHDRNPTKSDPYSKTILSSSKTGDSFSWNNSDVINKNIDSWTDSSSSKSASEDGSDVSTCHYY